MTPSEQIDDQISKLKDWRGKELARLRDVIHQTDPDIVEDWKWNTAVFTHNGNVCALGAFKDHVKVNFFKGASLHDPEGLFNAGLDAKATRAIDLYKDDKINSKALQTLFDKPSRQTTKAKKPLSEKMRLTIGAATNIRTTRRISGKTISRPLS